jgi:uncharacterized protein YjlB
VGDDIYPNNNKLPLLVYKGALRKTTNDLASIFEQLFEMNQWDKSWRNGIYGFHHYHSTAHEVLGVYGGSANVKLGGERGVELMVNQRDVIIIPAGVAHKNLGSSSNFAVVGAYPSGQQWDMCYGKSEERPRADEKIARVSLPRCDPVYGTKGYLINFWNG